MTGTDELKKSPNEAEDEKIPCVNFEELTSLISIRQYVVNATALPAIDRKTVNELNGILLLLDEKIISILTGVGFKEFIGFKDVQAAKERAVKITNIYSGIRNR